MTRGFLIFAHNNAEIDYGLQALVCATLIKCHLKENKVCLVTDDGTIGWLRDSRGASFVDRAFDDVKIISHDKAVAGSIKRIFRDSGSTSKTLLWHNGTRADAYALSPFDETIVVDSDYLVMDKSLDAVWGGPDDVMLPKRFIPLDGSPAMSSDKRITPFGVALRWATLVYFRKGKTAEALFNLVAHIKSTYSFWKQAHSMPGGLYRNDFSFSIAAHMLDGWTETTSIIPDLPGPGLVNTTDRDELIDVPAPGSLLFLCNDHREDWRYRLARADRLSVHVMNKFSIGRHADRLLDLHRTGT